MKRLLSLFLAVSMVFGLTIPVFAAAGVKIKVDGKELTDAQAILKDGSTLLPVRSVGNALGGDITWDAVTHTVVVEKGVTTVVMPVGESYIIVNEDVVSVSTPAQIINGRTYVPLRVLGDALNCGIKWVNETKTVEITSGIIETNISSETKNKDLFSNNGDVPYFMVDGLYLTEGEVVPVPVVGGNWIQWSNDNIRGEWSYYNGREVVLITGVDKGTSSLKIYLSSSKNGTIEGDYTEIKVHVVNENSDNYKKQREERIASGFDIKANQEEMILKEERLKKKLGLDLISVYNVNYIDKGGVLIIPIESDEELTGRLTITEDMNSGFEYALDEYDGKSAIFVKGNKIGNENIVLKYTELPCELELQIDSCTEEPDLLWEREAIRESSQYVGAASTAMWEFKINVVNSNNESFKKQQKERLEKGISYEMYLNGEA